jgi:outer membrane biosynthesis protein TonB
MVLHRYRKLNIFTMYYTNIMSAFEAEKNRKAFTYTTAIVVVLLLILIFWKWPLPPKPQPIAEEAIEINLGNFDEGFGAVQPLIKGEKSPGEEQSEAPKQTIAAAKSEPAKDVETDDIKNEEAAPVIRPEKTTPKAVDIPKQPSAQPVKNTAPAVVAEPKPQKPKIAGYSGPKGTGNGADETNGYQYQGNKPGGKADAGDPNGKADSYGNTPGGKTGGSGLRVSKGDRKILRTYIFESDLEKATINAIIKVSPDGKGTYVGRDKGSTTTDSRYINKIISYLPGIEFNKADHESIVTVPFNFTIKN